VKSVQDGWLVCRKGTDKHSHFKSKPAAKNLKHLLIRGIKPKSPYYLESARRLLTQDEFEHLHDKQNRSMLIKGVASVGKEHRGIKSIYKDYEEWEINTLEPHEPWGNSNRKISILLGMFMYITREYHAWLHNTAEGRLKNKELQEEMWVKCIEHHNMSNQDFHEIFVKGNRKLLDYYS